MSPHDAMAAELRACRSAAQAAAALLTELDIINGGRALHIDGRSIRPVWPEAESAMCELRAALAEVKL